MVSKCFRSAVLGFTLIGGTCLGQIPVGSGPSLGSQGPSHFYHLPAAPFQSIIREVPSRVPVPPPPPPLNVNQPVPLNIVSHPADNGLSVSVLEPNEPTSSTTQPRSTISSTISPVPSPVLAPSPMVAPTNQVPNDGRDALQPGQPLWEVFLQLIRQSAASESRAEAAREVVAAQEDAFQKQNEAISTQVQQLSEQQQATQQRLMEFAAQLQTTHQEIQSVAAQIEELRKQIPKPERIGAELAQMKKDDAVVHQRLAELVNTKFRELSSKLTADLEKRDREQQGTLRKEWDSFLKETKVMQQQLLDVSRERKSEEKRLHDLEQENAALRKEVEQERAEQRHLREELQRLERKKKPKK